MDVLDLKAKISLDKSEYDKGLDDASEKAGGFGAKIAGGIGKTVSTVAKVGAAAVGAASTAVAALTKQAVDSFANYEQLVGGVETLFGNSSDYVVRRASAAYETAGLSANDYMETVTSFSASLLQSLGGDTETAARVADQAVIDMSDNANKMGSSMESIQNAYQGFAKQNYTMLDNLKLGYGGTKEEMERLLRDAEQLEGYKVGSLDISNFSDVVEAIHIVQENMGIAGTTSKEAAETISGSFSMLQSAWQNTLTAIGEGDITTISETIGDLVYSAQTFGKNIIPVVQNALSGIVQLIGELAPEVAAVIPTIVSDILPQIIDAALEILGALGQALTENVDTILDAAGQVIDMLLNALVEATDGGGGQVMGIIQKIVGFLTENIPQVLEVGVLIITNLIQGISQALPTLIPTIVELVMDIAQTLIDNIPLLVDTAVQLVLGLADGIFNALPVLIDKIPSLIQSVVDAIVAALPLLIDGVIQLVMGIVEALPSLIVSIVNIIPSLINSVIEAVVTALPILIEGVTQLVIGLVDALPEIIIALVDAIPMIVESFVNGLIEALPMLIEGVTQLVIALVAALPEITMALIEAIPEIITGILNAAIPLTEGLLGVFSDAWTKSQAAFDGVGDFFVETFNGAKEAVSETWSDFAENFVTSWEGVKNSFVDVVPYFSQRFSEAVAIISEVWGTLQEFFAFSWESQKMVFADVGNYFGEKFRAGVSNIKSAFSEITSFFTDLWARIRNIFADAPQKFAEIGKNIVAGIKNGISNAWANFKDWVLKMFGDLLGSIKGILGISSPSKVFANEVGKWIPAGIAVGIEDNMGTLDKAIEGMYREIPLDFSATNAANVATVSDASNTTADGGGMAEILSLLREIRDGGNVTVVLEGDADRLFRVMQSKANSNYRLTGNAGLLTI